MRVTGGNVGIGTTSPSALLHAYKSSGSAVIRADYNGATTIDMTASSSGNAFISSNTTLIFENGSTPTERMRITSGGDIGIGNTGDASVRLFVSGKDTSSNNYAALFRNSSGSNLLGVKNSGTVNMGSLPTSSSGLSSGDIYVAAGVLMIV
jgi:hypothetical protein